MLHELILKIMINSEKINIIDSEMRTKAENNNPIFFKMFILIILIDYNYAQS